MDYQENQTNNMESTDQKPLSKRKHFNALKWILVLGIVVVLNLFFNFAVKLVYDSPEYNQYCMEKQVRVHPETQEECLAEGGQWSENTRINKLETEVMGFCDVDYTCRMEFDDARSVYNRNVFVVLVVLGVASIALGIFIPAASVSLGFSLGGVLSLIIATIRFWSNMNDFLRVGVLAIALIALVWVGIKKLKD